MENVRVVSEFRKTSELENVRVVPALEVIRVGKSHLWIVSD